MQAIFSEPINTKYDLRWLMLNLMWVELRFGHLRNERVFVFLDRGTIQSISEQ